MPDAGFHGYDTFVVQVSDGFATDIITIGLHVGLPDSGTIYVTENGCASRFKCGLPPVTPACCLRIISATI